MNDSRQNRAKKLAALVEAEAFGIVQHLAIGRIRRGGPEFAGERQGVLDEQAFDRVRDGYCQR